jgi:hypothetical protein
VVPLEGAEEGTDRWAVEQGWISLTPLRLDLTDDQKLEEVRAERPLDESVALAISPPKSSPEAEQAVRREEAPAVALPVAENPPRE